MPKRQHYQFGEVEPVKSQQVKTKHRPPSKEMLRRLALEDTGPKAQCHFCKIHYGMSYMRMCYVKWRVTDWVCKDCKDEYGLQSE